MDAREFKQRFMPHHRLLYRVAYHLTGNAQDAEDLLQDMYLKLWQKRDDLPDEAMKEDLMKHCKAHIAKYALPSEIEFRDSLPTTLVGKVAYTVLEKEEARKSA